MLIPNRASAWATLRAMMPWTLSLGLLVSLGGGLGALGLLERHEGQVGLAVLAIVLFLGGIVGTAVRSARTPQPTLAIELDLHDVRIIDLRSDRILAAAPLLQVTATPATHTYGGRISYTMPVLMLVLPGSQAIALGIHGYRFAWQGKVRSLGAPTYVVGDADWLTLVERFGLRQLTTS